MLAARSLRASPGAARTAGVRARAPALRAVPVGVDIVVGVIAVSVIADVAQVFARKAERDAERKAERDAERKAAGDAAAAEKKK